MEETYSMIFRGFKLVEELKSKIPELAGRQPEILTKSLDEIVKTFGAANDQLKNVVLSAVPGSDQAASKGSGPLPMQIDPNDLVQEYWLRCGVTQAMGAVVPTQMAAREAVTQREGLDPLQRLEGSDHGKGDSSSSSRSTRRKDEEIQTVLAPAPRMGNTEIPPDDSYTWRKYGQKEILGSRFPRAYYRCSHQKLYNCPAKKQVQRLDNDPHTFQVTYRGAHTCHISATAPASSAGPSTVRYGKEADYPVVADMADAMFNPGRSSGSSMDIIFPSDHHHHQHDGDHHHHHHHGDD